MIKSCRRGEVVFYVRTEFCVHECNARFNIRMPEQGYKQQRFVFTVAVSLIVDFLGMVCTMRILANFNSGIPNIVLNKTDRFVGISLDVSAAFVHQEGSLPQKGSFKNRWWCINASRPYRYFIPIFVFCDLYVAVVIIPSCSVGFLLRNSNLLVFPFEFR